MTWVQSDVAAPTSSTISEKMGKFYTLVVDNKDIIIGAALAIGGNLLISIAMNVQKYSLTCLQRQEEVEQIYENSSNSDQSSFFQQNKYLKSRMWWCGITLMILGEVGNFMAYGFAPASVVAPLGTTTVVANTYIAVFFLGEHFRCQDALGTAVIVVGAFLIVMFSTHDEVRLNAVEIVNHLGHWPFLVYVVIEIGLFILANFLLFRRRVLHVVLFILPAALLASATVIAAKAVAGMITLTIFGDSQLYFLIFYVMLIILPVTGVLQVRYVTQAMQFFNATVVVPTFFVFFTLSAILAGIFFYGEFEGLTLVQILIFLFGCCFSFLGVYFISSGRLDVNDEPEMPTEGQPLLERSQSDGPFTCLGLTIQHVQPASDEEDPQYDEHGKKIVEKPHLLPNHPDGLFNPDQHMASDISPSSPVRNKKLLSPSSYQEGMSLYSMENNGSNGRSTMAKSLSWDSSYDPRCLELQERNGERTYRRVPSRIAKERSRDSRLSGSSSSSS
ncbi:NIPA-like protein 2 isoform X2 [Amphiura filiformis]|uniref:NIPA-like protein 2 isoform X2 n=1 Tax=Amphiura filiformis TaxID=82378 RepID=UPI003B224C68